MARIIIFLAVMILSVPVVAENALSPDDSGVAHQTAVPPTAPVKDAPQLTGQPADEFWAWWNNYDGPIRTAFLMFAGVAGFGFAYWRARIATRQASIAGRGHAIDRFSTAVEHLVSEHIPVRLGGIDALWRIGRDSPKEQQETVMGILCAFLRHPPHWTKEDNRRSTEDLPAARSDVQAILRLIGNHDAWYRHDLPDYLLNLRGAVLSGVVLSEGYLAGAYLAQVKLTSAHLRDTNFVGAYLWSADFVNANICGADFSGVNLMNANLSGADLTGADLGDANLYQAKLESADLGDANFAGTNLAEAYLMNAKNLSQAQLDVACVEQGGRVPVLPKGFNLPTNICPED